MRQAALKLICALILWPALAGAQEQAAPQKPARPPQPEETLLAEEWLSLAEGKTVYYSFEGRYAGKEYFFPGSNKSIFVSEGGECLEGTWREDAGLFCFDYQSIYCFHHVRRAGKIYSRAQDGEEHLVSRVADEALSCSQHLSS